MAMWSLAGAAAEATCPAPATHAYAGPMFDAMAQTDQWLAGENAVKTAQSNGIRGIALFARVHKKQDGRRLVQVLAAKNPGFVIVGAPKLFDMRGDLDSDYVSDVALGVADNRYAFVGEILYTHGDKGGGEVTADGERYIDPTQPGTARLLEALRGRTIPVMTHWEVYDWERDWPKFDKVYGQFPDQVFIWPHLGFADAQQATVVLAAHNNVWATLSKKEKSNENLADSDKEDAIGPPVTDQCDVLEPAWKKFMMDFHEQLLFATDAHKSHRWANYANIVQRWRVILGQLPPDVAEDIAYRNAEKLYGVRKVATPE
jgi:hypothetical protein